MASAPSVLETSANTTEYPRAGLWRRLAALLYDGFLVAAIWMLLGYVMQFIFGVDSNQLVDGRVQTDPVQDVLLFSLMIGSAAGFYCYFWMRSGQTLGMLAWRLRVQNQQGGTINLQQALIRFVLAWPAFFAAGLGYLWLYVDRNGDAVHDRWSGTQVVLVPRSHRPF